MRNSTTWVLVATLFFASVAGFFFLEHQRGSEDLEEASDSLEEVQNLTRVQTAQIDKLQADLEKKAGALREQEEAVVRLKRDMDGVRKERDRLEADRRRFEVERQRAAVAAARLQAAVAALEQRMRSGLTSADVAVSQEDGRLRLNVAVRVLFGSGSADLLPTGQELLRQVAGAGLAAGGYEVRVEGHTDDVPVGTNLVQRFPTNWELSTARATAAVRFLGEAAGIPANRLAAVGYADSRPLVPNDSEANRAKNRRIEILVVPVEEPGRESDTPREAEALSKPVVGS